jgi:hypothetical protein
MPPLTLNKPINKHGAVSWSQRLLSTVTIKSVSIHIRHNFHSSQANAPQILDLLPRLSLGLAQVRMEEVHVLRDVAGAKALHRVLHVVHRDRRCQAAELGDVLRKVRVAECVFG